MPNDTIARLESKIILSIAQYQGLIQNESLKLDSLNELKNKSTISLKTLTALNKKVNNSKYNQAYYYRILNSYKYILTTLRQLKFQKEETANLQLKELHLAMIQLEQNKIPVFKNIKKISSLPNTKDNPNVYDKNLYTYCNLTKNSEGSMFANVFEIFFEYTDPKIGTHFKENEFLKCQSRFIKTKKEYFLELQFIIRSPKASQLYGSIDPSSPSRLDFINGKHIYLQSYALTSAMVEPVTGNTVYNIQYKLDNEDLDHIKKYDVDAFTIIWSSGADRFEIYKLDVLKNMLECLQKKKLRN